MSKRLDDVIAAASVSTPRDKAKPKRKVRTAQEQFDREGFVAFSLGKPDDFDQVADFLHANLGD